MEKFETELNCSFMSKVSAFVWKYCPPIDPGYNHCQQPAFPQLMNTADTFFCSVCHGLYSHGFGTDLYNSLAVGLIKYNKNGY